MQIYLILYENRHLGLTSYLTAGYRRELWRRAWATTWGVLGGAPVSPCVTHAVCFSASKVEIKPITSLFFNLLKTVVSMIQEIPLCTRLRSAQSIF